MQHRMKKKYWIIIVINLLLIGFVVISERLQIKDVVFVYLLVLIPSYILTNIEYLFKRKKISYSKFLTDKLFFNLFITIVFFGLIIYATQPKYISKEYAENDLKFMVNSLESIHPDIYHVISKDSFAIEVYNEINNLAEKTTELEFYKVCARLTSLFRTGHTRPMESVFGARIILKRAFPFQTKVINEKLFVTENLTSFSAIPIGSEIIEINGKNINQVIDEWSSLVSYENIAFRNHQITKPTKIGIWNDFKGFRIKYLDYKSNKIKERNVNGGVCSNMYRFLRTKFSKPNKLFYQELTPNIGYIGFFDCHDLDNYIKFYESTFNELKIKGFDNLIIDIRNNGGGHTIIGAELMQYIFHQPFTERDSSTRKISNELIATGKVDKKFEADKRVPGKLITTVFEPIQLIDNPLRFKGNTYLLTDNGTFSAAQGFASSYKCYGNGTIVGEETGGVTVNFADVHFFDLPQTRLKVMTSWEKAYFPCGIDNNRGVLPDYYVSNSIQDYIKKKDRVLEFTIDLINEEQKTPHNTLYK